MPAVPRTNLIFFRIKIAPGGNRTRELALKEDKRATLQAIRLAERFLIRVGYISTIFRNSDNQKHLLSIFIL